MLNAFSNLGYNFALSNLGHTVSNLSQTVTRFWNRTDVPKTTKFIDIPAAVRNSILMEFLTPKEHHLFKRVLKGVTCKCYPLCQLVHDQFTKVVLHHSVRETSRFASARYPKHDQPPINGNFRTFTFDPGADRILAGDSSDYTTNAAVSVFNTEGRVQFTTQKSSWDKSVVAVKQVGDRIIAFGSREFGIWNAADGAKIYESKNEFDLRICVFSENQRGAFIAPYGNSIGYIDYTTENPWATYKPFLHNTHTGRINWIKEDPITGFILSGCEKGIVNVWSSDHQFVCAIKTGETCGKYDYHSSRQLLFASLDNSNVGIWNINDGSLKLALKAEHDLAVSEEGFGALEWNEKEKCLYASWKFMRKGNLGGSALIWWDIETGNQLGSFPLIDPQSGLYHNVYQVAFNSSAGPRAILTGGYGIQLWTAKGKLLWHKPDLGWVERFEWNQENKKIFTLAPHSESKLSLTMFTYK
jgi:WD40 repeat protein